MTFPLAALTSYSPLLPFPYLPILAILFMDSKQQGVVNDVVIRQKFASTFSISCTSDCLIFPVTFFSWVFWGADYPDEFEPTSVHDAPGPTMDPMGSKILIHWSTTQIWNMCPFLTKLDLFIGLLKINILKRWHGQGTQRVSLHWDCWASWNVPWGPHVDLFSQ